jgi:hypothetical protein
LAQLPLCLTEFALKTLQLGLKGTHLTLVLALNGAHLTLDCSDPVGRGVLRMSNDRQHRRTDRRYPTIKAIAIAKFDTHPPSPFWRYS